MNFNAFVGSFHKSQARRAAQERLVNYYVENIGGDMDRGLFPAPGFRPFAAPAPGVGRGLFSQNDRTFAVIDGRLVEVNADGTYTERPLTTLPDWDFMQYPAHARPGPAPAALAQPNPPRVSQGGAIGTTIYGYKISATNAIGESIASLEGTISTGPAALDANNFIHVAWDQVPGATGYKVYRTKGGTTPPKLIATVGAVLFTQDTGQAGTAATPPITNTSGGTFMGSTRWAYRITAVLGLGVSTTTVDISTDVGYAVLNDTYYTEMFWLPIPNAQAYKVYRVEGPGVNAPRLIATITDLTTQSEHGPWADSIMFKDTGQVGELENPVLANTTIGQGLVDDGTPVSISSSGDAGQQLFIISAGNGYVFDLRTNVFALVIQGATFGDFLEGRFIALDAGSSTFRWSGIFKGFDWNDTDFEQRSTAGDKWVAMAVINKEIWFIGTESSDVWVHTGAPLPASPFAPIDSVFIEKGTGAAFSVRKVAGSLFWLQQDKAGGGIVVSTGGQYGVERVSDHQLEAALRKYQTLSDAEAFDYQDLGHHFYVLSFPTEGHTWVYDLATREWHERGHWRPNATEFSVYRPRAHAYAFSGVTSGLHLVIDRDTGAIYQMDPDYGYDIDGDVLRRIRRAPHIRSNQNTITHHELELLLDTGEGVTAGQGKDPTMMLHWSDDSGKTWSHEHWRSAGKKGHYDWRVRWHQLGAARERIYEVIVTDPTPWRIVGARLDARAGAH